MAAVTSVIAGAGLAISAGSAGMSFAQAGKQRKLQRQAEADAEQAMAEARKKLEVNFFDQLAIQKEPYELQREALLAQGAQAIEAGAESERGAAATAGRIAMAQNEAQAGIRTEMGKELMALEKLSAQEESRLRDVGVNLDLAEVQGAQQAASDAQKAAAAATAQGMQSINSLAQQAIQMAPLYSKTAEAKQIGQIEKAAMGTNKGQLGLSQADMQKSIASMGTVNNVDLSQVGKMNPTQYKTFMSGLDAGTLKQIKANMPNYMSSFNPNPQGIKASYSPYYLGQF